MAFFYALPGHSKLYENGWEIPLFFVCGRRKRGRPYPFPHGRPGGDTGAQNHRKYTEHFKQPEQFISLNGQVIALPAEPENLIALPAEPENPLRTAEMTLEDDYGMIDGVLNNGHRGEELEKAQCEARRTTPEKKPSIRDRLAEAKRESVERKPPDKAHQKKPPEHDL